MLGQPVILQPRHIMGYPDVMLGHHARVVIQGCDTHDHHRQMRSFGHQMRAAPRTEMTQLARRGFLGGQWLLALQRAKMPALDLGGGRKRGRMSLATGVAMTMPDRHIDSVDFILDGPASTAALHTRSLTMIRFKT